MPEITIAPHYGPAKRAIFKGLERYNRSKVGKLPWKNFAVTLNEGEDVVGGITGEAWGGWLFINAFWIEERYRGHDYGTALISKLEEEARAFGAKYAYVDTYTFQARPFYEKQGYRVFGELEDFPPGHARYWLRKEL
ncbi:MAG: GNAT family N-acetyltransferase [Beijerinckiaceae bacterium]